MPCNSDYMEPTAKERELKRAAKLLVYVLRAQNKRVSKHVGRAALDIYGDSGGYDYVEHLCGELRNLSVEDRESIVYDAHNKIARDLADWYEEHQEADKAREAKEK